MPTPAECNEAGLGHARRGDFAAAADAFRQSVTLSPDYSPGWNNLGNSLKHLGELHEAANALRRAGALTPREPDAWTNLGEVCRLLGQFSDARDAYQRATEHAPPFHPAWSNRLMHFNYDPTVSAEELKGEHRNWGRRITAPASSAFPNDRDPSRPLRIGFVSPDLREHPVARFLGPILTNFDRSAFSVCLYAEMIAADATSQRFHDAAALWRWTIGQSAQAIAGQIRADGIDILIDLAGHTGHNRLDIFALRPAPVQATYLGYPNSTGLSVVDAWITDNIVVTRNYASELSERIIAIPGGFSCFEMPRVTMPADRMSGPFTFVSHHSLGKLNNVVLAMWSRVMAGSPDSRLLVFRQTMTSASAEILRVRMENLGIDPSRVGFRQVSSKSEQYLSIYREADVILDTFPFGGHTMTCEALAMGVPLVARRGDTPASRLSASVLTSLGLTELIADSDDDYLNIAHRLATDAEQRRSLRSNLPAKMKQYLADGPAFASKFEAALRELWRDWCKKPQTDPKSPRTHMPTGDDNDRGIALARTGRIAEARDAFLEAIRVAPERAGAHFNLGLAWLRLGNPVEAERSFERSIRLEPTDADAHFQLGQLYRQTGRLAEAAVAFRHTIQFNTKRADAHKALGSILFDSGQSAAAIESFRAAIALTPNDAELHNDLGNALRQLERNDEATESYRRALQLNPNLGPAHANLGNLLAERGDTGEAKRAYAAAFAEQRIARLRVLADTVLPVIYDSLDHVRQTRAELATNLDRMIADGIRMDPTSELIPTHFYLAYQGENDREFHAMFAKLCDGTRSVQLPKPKTERSSRIKVGFLSRHLRNHTIGQLNHGLIARLPRDRFEVSVLLAGPPPDDLLGTRIAQQCDHFYRVPGTLPDAVCMVHSLGLDILFWPDVGMDAQTYAMTFSRLAPVQVATWGHPVTTGVATMDYFISSEDLEIPGAATHYSERLVKLDRLAVHYERPAPPTNRKDRAYYSLPDRGTLYVCPQTIFKFHPEFDALLGAILNRDPSGRLVLIDGRYKQWNDHLMKRFRKSLGDAADRVVWVRKLHREDFLGLISLADVMIDPIHFGGGNTSYEGFALGIPVVTLPSNYLRGRLTYAMYRQMGIMDLVADSNEHYVELAVRLGVEPDFNRAVRRKIAEASPALFADDAAVRAFANWLQASVDR